MDANAQPRKPGRPNILTRAAGAPDEIIRLSPQGDVDHINWTVVACFLSTIFETGVLTATGETLFSPEGLGHVVAFVCALFVALMLAMLDLRVFLASSFFSLGVKWHEQTAGVDLGGRSGMAWIKTFAANLTRVLIVFGFSGLTALSLSLVINADDLSRQKILDWQMEHPALVASAKQQIDAQVKSAAEAEAAQQANVAALQGQLDTDRERAVDGLAGDPRMEAAQREVAQLTSDLSRARAASDQASALAGAENGGLQLAGASGVPGHGPKAKAAEALATIASDRVAQIEADLASARQRLADLSKTLADTAAPLQNRAEAQVEPLSAQLTEATSRLEVLRSRHHALAAGYDQEVQHVIEGAPDYVPPGTGFMSRVADLEKLLRDPGALFVEGLIAVATACLEISFLIVRVLGGGPITFSAILVSRTLVEVSNIVEDTIEEINARSGRASTPEPELPPEGQDQSAVSSMGEGFGLFRRRASDGTMPKRGRGRPRKILPN